MGKKKKLIFRSRWIRRGRTDPFFPVSFGPYMLFDSVRFASCSFSRLLSKAFLSSDHPLLDARTHGNESRPTGRQPEESRIVMKNFFSFPSFFFFSSSLGRQAGGPGMLNSPTILCVRILFVRKKEKSKRDEGRRVRTRMEVVRSGSFRLARSFE